jgi:hypothetical protein
MDDYEKMCSLDNLNRAYRWIQSNPDAKYKSYFRDAYAAYAASSQQNLIRLRKHLLRDAYDPGHASKVYLPKPSGILRPYTLLTVNDQIVYQACVNVIAEKLMPIVKKRYLKTTFGHLYAGKSSKFFYLKWQDGYRAYSSTILYNINKGYKFAANFDLAAFYDSIDHNVIKHFLEKLTVDHDLIDFLLRCLKKWTSYTWTSVPNVIYLGHGIPQGPLSSGLLSEVVIKHLDDKGIRQRGPIKYLRYVDDIKIFAKLEKQLRQRLVSLDIASKEIGLFPQSAKVGIREITNPYDEIKTVSRPPEPSFSPVPNQKLMRKRLLELTKGSKVKHEDSTRFKFLLARVKTNHQLNKRLIGVLKRHPVLYTEIAFYFSQYKRLPTLSADQLLRLLKEEEIYHALNASILNATLDNMPEPYKGQSIVYCYNRLFMQKDKPPPQPTLKAALLSWLLKHNRITYADLEKSIMNENDWWVTKEVLKFLLPEQYGPATYGLFLNNTICSTNAEIARIAALKICDDNVPFNKPLKEVNEAARLLLYAAGRTRHIGKPESLVGAVLSNVLAKDYKGYNWTKLFGIRHKNAEQIAFTLRRTFESDINSCIITLDSLCDLFWEVLFIKYLPGKTYGNYGGMLSNPTMNTKLPITSRSFAKLHKLRLESLTAHPRNQKTGDPTRRLKHNDFYKIKPELQRAFNEVVLKVTP